jgi:hypothetical protein
LRNPYSLYLKSGGLRLCLVTRWLLGAAHSLGQPLSCLQWRERCSRQPGLGRHPSMSLQRNLLTLLAQAIWMPVPLIFVLMNPLGTSPARGLISQILIGKVLLGTVPHLIYGNLSCL